MNALPLAFGKSGWHHQQVFRKDSIAVYKRWKDTSTAPHYETIRILWRKAGEFAGRQFEAGEAYPSESHFGTNAWSYQTEDQALAKAQVLLAKP